MTDVRFKVYRQIEGLAGFEYLGDVAADVYASLIPERFGLKKDEVLYTVNRTVDGELGWLVKVKSTDPIVRLKFQRYEDLATICSFLGFLHRGDPNALYGARTASETLAAWKRVSGMSQEQIDHILDAKGGLSQ